MSQKDRATLPLAWQELFALWPPGLEQPVSHILEEGLWRQHWPSWLAWLLGRRKRAEVGKHGGFLLLADLAGKT